MKRLAALLICLSGCSGRSELALDYTLVGITPTDLVRLETLISVDPSDPRLFFADAPYREVADGVGYEVRDFDGSGKRQVLVTHDSSLGFVFKSKFTFTLLPPSGETAPPLILVARAYGDTDRIGSSATLKGTFGENRHLPVPVMDTRCNGVTCAASQICCNSACVDTASDEANCGACNQACGINADSCTLGTCRCGSGSSCDSTQTCCSGLGCVDLNSSPFNCGACNHACNPGETCQSGQCTCGSGASCGAGGLCCPDGSCSASGSCACGSMACAAPSLCCDATAGTCVDVRSSADNCGACGVPCASPLSCQSGACTCQGQICGGGDDCCSAGCANLQNDAANCGSCGNTCALNESCVGGQCQCGSTTCTADQACCGGQCVDPNMDSMNCGGCGVLCNPGESCVGGVCQCPGTSPARACVAPPEACCASSSLDNGGCFDLTASHDHCGACGIGCRSNEQCESGHCIATSCDPACTNQNSCAGGQCTCNNSGACSDPKTCCGADGCVDTSSDRDHCGNCSTVCTVSTLCCGSGCVARNAMHCSACNQACATGSNGGNMFCCPSSANPDPDTSWQCVAESVNNCGSCGKMCAHGQNCCSGSCKNESDFACGTSCANCNASHGICCNGKCQGCIAGLLCLCT